jgi:CO dehydrogenase nickel-insertion accessory protein CooC1
VVTQPTAKSIDVARRAAEIAEGAAARVLVVANRVRDDDDLLAIRTALAQKELIVVPDDPVIAAADRERRAPIDVGPDAPGVQVIVGLGEQLAREAGA